MMNDRQRRAEFKRRRTVAIRKLREAGMSEAEIREELAKLQSDYDLDSESEGHESVDNLPAVIESADEASSTEPIEQPWPSKPYGGIDPKDFPPGYAVQHDSALNKNPQRRCVATNSRGEQCRKFAIFGGTVCRTHGGATRHVKEQARVRVEMHSNALMGKLIEIAYDDTRPASVQLDAIKDSLNRAGLTKPTQVEVGPIKPFEEVFDDIASGSRADYRAGGGSDDQASQLDDLYATGQMMHRDYSAPDDPDNPPHTAPATPNQRTGTPNGRGGHRDSDPLSEPSARRERARDRWQGSGHITGEDAIRTANQINAEVGALRALPPGRSGR